MLYLESPAGVGYSYAENGSVAWSDNDVCIFFFNLKNLFLQVSLQNAHAVKDFFKIFPEYKNNDFYISGESYAGVRLALWRNLIQLFFKLN
jgi:carboxypeptidase C (cathepsin A)